MGEKKPAKNVEKLIAKAEAGKAEKRRRAEAPKNPVRAAKEMHLRGAPKRSPAPTHVLTLIAKHLKKGK